jgi:hypothetical protein
MALVGVLMAAPMVRAASPGESECDEDSKAAAQLRIAGALMAAHARLASCLSAGCSNRLRDACAHEMTAIEAATPTVMLEAKDEASNSLTAVHVTMDGESFLERLDGAAVPVDPGDHLLTFDAPGFGRTEAGFSAREGQKKIRVVVFLRAAPHARSNSLILSSPASAPGRRDEPSTLATRRNVGLALGCAGIAGVAVGTIWSLVSKATYDHALASECGGDANRCSMVGIADGQTAHQQAAVATVSFVAAGALLAAGAGLFLTSPKRNGVSIAPSVGGGGGVTVGGKW